MDRTTYAYESPRRIEEKSASVAQQHLMGAAYRAKKTGRPTFPLAQELADGMTEKQLRDFAGTKHGDLPKHVSKKSRNDEGMKRVVPTARPGLMREDGRLKGFGQWLSEIEESAIEDNPGQGGGEDDDSLVQHELTRDDAVVVALQELGLPTKSQIDPDKDGETIAAAMPVKLSLVRSKLDGSDRIQAMAGENPAVQKVLADRNATIQDLVVAMSNDGGDDDDRSDRFRSLMGDDGDMDQEIQKGRDDDDPFSPL